MQFHQPPDQREPDAEPAARHVIDAREHAEDPVAHLRRETHAVVGHDDVDVCIVQVCGDRHVAARLGVLERIAQQVAEHLRQAHQIAMQQHGPRRQVQLQPVAAGLHRRAAGLDRLLQHVTERHVVGHPQFEPVLRDAAHVEQVVDQSHQMPELAADDLARPALQHDTPGACSLAVSALAIGASGLRSS